jgi:thiol-disulfide isomerase/thioredoxin
MSVPRSGSDQRPAWMKVAFLSAALFAAGAIVMVVVLDHRGEPSAATRSGFPAASSDSGALELNGTDLSGRPLSLSSFAGKPIVLNIWGAWCKSYSEARALARFERAHPEAQVVGIDIQDTKAAAKAFHRRVGWTHPSIYDPTGQLAAQLDLQAVPTTLFLDRQHRIVWRIVSDTNLAGFEAGLRKATQP